MIGSMENNRFYSLTVSVHLPSDSSLVFSDFIICNAIERILRVGCLVHLGIVLVVALNNSLGCRTHQHDMVTCCGDSSVVNAMCLVPSDTLEYVGLRSSRDNVRSAVLFNLSNG